MTNTPGRWEADESGLYVFAYDSAGRACVAVEICGWGMLSNKFGEEKAIEIQKERAHRIAALWNMAERLGLNTEEINTKESLFRAAADMLKALEWYEWKVDGCRKNTLEGDRARYDLDRDGGSRAYAAIKKARGEE